MSRLCLDIAMHSFRMWELRLTGNIGFPITQGIILPAIFGYFICATPFLETVGNPTSHLTRHSDLYRINMLCRIWNFLPKTRGYRHVYKIFEHCTISISWVNGNTIFCVGRNSDIFYDINGTICNTMAEVCSLNNKHKQ